MDTIIFFKETPNSPRICVTANGKVSIEGTSLVDYPVTFYLPIADVLFHLNTPQFIFNINIDFSDRDNFKQILKLIESAKQNPYAQTLSVTWSSDNEYQTDKKNIENIEKILGKPINVWHDNCFNFLTKYDIH